MRNDFTNNIGWLWMSDNQGACSVGIEGAVDTSLGLVNMSSTGKFDGTFPAIHFTALSGINDYNQGVMGVGAGGYLSPTWSRSVCSDACTCCDEGTAECNATNRWNLAAKIARVLP